MSLYESFLRPLMFRMDPESIHEKALKAIASGALRLPRFDDPRLEQTLFGVQFSNPLGLAAGFDKNAVAIDHWKRLGFGFMEMGTITYHAQPGNDKPRLFRLPKDKGLINRMGFNNDGAHALVPRLAAARPGIPVGINMGKSKVTPIEDAAKDYQESFKLLQSLGDYFVVNVSSPNTPGLRTLQEKGPLLEILAALREVNGEKPMFVKVAPDLELSALDDVIEVAHEAKLTGLIATNTTIGREGLWQDPGEAGGLSGRPVWEKSNRVLSYFRKAVDKDMILIGVGGIFTGQDMFDKIKLGAHLCQMYTGWIYGGPNTAPRILKELVDLMDRDGIKTLDELRASG